MVLDAKLYRMRSLQTSYWRDEIDNLFKDKLLYFPSIEQLNDAADCTIKVRANNPSEVKKFYKRYKPDIDRRRRAEGVRKSTLETMKKVYRANVRICDQAMSVNRVLCLTTRIESNALWSYYGDSNTGVAFGFKLSDYFLPKLVPRPVNYVDRLRAPSYLDWCRIALFEDTRKFEQALGRTNSEQLVDAVLSRGANVVVEGIKAYANNPKGTADAMNGMSPEIWAFSDLLYFQKLKDYSNEAEWRQVSTGSTRQGYCQYVGMDLVSITFGLKADPDKVDYLAEKAAGRWKLYQMQLQDDGTLYRSALPN